MATWKDVERLHKADPESTSYEIAKVLGCTPEYVRATFQRRGWKLTQTQPGGLPRSHRLNLILAGAGLLVRV